MANSKSGGKIPATTEQSVKIQHARLSRAALAMNRAGRALNYLMRLAGGEDEVLAGYAVSGLSHMLINAVGNFQHLVEGEVNAERHRELTEQILGPQPRRKSRFAPIAGKLDRWPILYYAHAEKRSDLEEVLKSLQLAADLGINYSGKPFSFSTPANGIVFSLYQFMEQYRGREADVSVKILNGRTLTAEEELQLNLWIRKSLRHLPRLARKSKILKQWRELGEELLPFFFGSEFQDHSQLRRLAEKADHTKAGKPARWSERKLIKRTLADAWQRIARHIGGE